MTRKEALDAIKALEYRADEGETWKDVAMRGGVDVDSLLEAANRGAKKANMLAAEEKAPYPDGTRLRGPNGKMFVVRNGKPVEE